MYRTYSIEDAGVGMSGGVNYPINMLHPPLHVPLLPPPSPHQEMGGGIVQLHIFAHLDQKMANAELSRVPSKLLELFYIHIVALEDCTVLSIDQHQAFVCILHCSGIVHCSVADMHA